MTASAKKLLVLTKSRIEELLMAGRVAARTLYSREGGFFVVVETGHETAFTANVGGARGLKIVVSPEGIIALSRGDVRQTLWLFWAMLWHELGHVMFTDMTFRPIDAAAAGDRDLLAFMMKVQNILEDPKIEESISILVETRYGYYEWVRPREVFARLRDWYWMPLAKKYQDRGTAESLVDYLLLRGRVGEANVAPCAAFEARRSWLAPALGEAFAEPDPSKRQAKQAEIARRIWASFPKEKRSGKPSFDPAACLKSPFGEMGGPVFGGMAQQAPGSGQGSAGGAPQSGDGKGSGKGSGNGAGDGDGLLSSAPAEGEWNSALDSARDHVWLDMREEVIYPQSLRREAEERLDKAIPVAADVADYLKLFEGRKRPRWESGYRSGDRLDVRAIVAGKAQGLPRLDIFKRKVPGGRMPDVAVTVLVDCSGSMRGLDDRAAIASEAAFAMAWACDEAKVPLQILSFGRIGGGCRDGTEMTVVHKRFEEPLDDALPRILGTDANRGGAFRPIPEIILSDGSRARSMRWMDNAEEVSLWHIWQRLKKVNHEHKLVIVFCDGQTRGSRAALKGVVRGMEEDGIGVIGVGILSEDVGKTSSDPDPLYPHHRVFGSEKELRNGLAPFLLETLEILVTEE